MPRGRKIRKQKIWPPDPLYGNRLVSRLINRVMRDGKKTAGQKQVYKALEIIKSKDKDPIEILQEAIKNISPQMEVRSRRIGGAAYQVPLPVKGNQRMALAIRWLILEARKRPNKEYHAFGEKLAAELLDAYHYTGGAVKRKEISHKMAEANRAFAHFRW